ncbi:MAG: PadR family transcriptional regulator [Spirochaetia bacterium]|jgi:DNA-binding PadR family transcriptional regulator|nr:PadR family transcriptional regulator [Spirochaetia bacterium]
MASEKKLDCVILGLLSHEELSGYAIKKLIDTELSYFWGASYGSIYPTLAGLVDRELATRRTGSDNGRNKWLYAITGEGHQYLQQWLLQPICKDELRYETLLKLFFGNEVGADQTVSHIRAFRKKFKKELADLLLAEQVLEKILGDETHRYYLLTVRFGIKSYRAYLEWCDEAEAMLQGKERS